MDEKAEKKAAQEEIPQEEVDAKLRDASGAFRRGWTRLERGAFSYHREQAMANVRRAVAEAKPAPQGIRRVLELLDFSSMGPVPLAFTAAVTLSLATWFWSGLRPEIDAPQVARAPLEADTSFEIRFQEAVNDLEEGAVFDELHTALEKFEEDTGEDGSGLDIAAVHEEIEATIEEAGRMIESSLDEELEIS